MAESFSVKAILSAKDSGFSSTLKNAANTISSIDKKISGLAFGFLTGAGQAAFNKLTGAASSLVGEINSSNKAWKTFEGNMTILGKSEKEISSVKGTLQEYAQTTIYSSSDMASSYAQLAAVGIKSADKLVTGFGGLAGAAEDPAQAMKTLSQQGVQMAAKPTVAWQDFKLMLEQTPAGMAAVAKHMGMTTSELVTAIQDGKVKTNEFFKAIDAVGNSEGFTKLATEYKSVDQAMDGLQETLGNKLLPSFDVISKKGISAISGIIDKLGKIDGQAVADKVSAIITKVEQFGAKCTPYIEAFKEAFSGVRTEVLNAFTAVKDSLAELNGEFGSAESVEGFKGAMTSVADVIKSIASWVSEHSDSIAKLISYLPKIAAGLAAFKVAKTVAPFVSTFAGGIAKIAAKVGGGLAGKLFGTAKAQQTVGETSATTGAQVLSAAKAFALMGVGVLLIAVGFALLAQSAIALANAGGLAIGVMAGLVIGVAALGLGMALLLKSLAPMSAQLMPVALAFLAMGAAVMLISAGFALLAYSAIQLANAGGLAIGVMVGMVAAIALLAVGAALLGSALTAGAVGFIAFGAAVLMVGAGFALIGVAALLAANALTIVATVLPIIATSGLQGALAIAALGASLIVFAAGAAMAGIAAVVLGAGLIVVGAALLVVGAGALIAAAGIIALSASVMLLSAGVLVFGAGLIVAGAGALILAAGLKTVNSSMKSIAKNAKSTEKSLKSMNKSVDLVSSGLDAIGDKAKSAMSKLTSAFDKSASKAQTSGKKVGTGFTKGLQNGLNTAPAVATRAVTTVTAQLTAGRSAAFASGAYISIGFAQGMLSQLAVIKAAAAQMAAAADKALQAKAKIHSPSKVTTEDGGDFGQGWVNGILGKVKAARKAVEALIYIPQVATPQFAYAYAGELSSDYTYSTNGEYVIEVPLSIDGREVAKATASYTQGELNKKHIRENRKKGKV